MEVLKLLNLLSVSMSKEKAVEKLEKDIETWKKDPSSKNFSGITISCMLITLKEIQDKMGDNPFDGFMKVNSDIDEGQKISNMMDRMSGDHIDKSKN